MRRYLFAFIGLASACSLVVDGKLDGKEAAPDCEGADDGTPCELDGSEAMGICRSQACSVSTCGDGLVDANNEEQCDDGNEVSGDGCEPGSCAFSCEADADCEDIFVCNGTESCDAATHTCTAGTSAADGTACVLEDESDGECRAGTCRVFGCGNGLPDDGEQCDDGNEVSNDGCESDCTVSCFTDEDCVELDQTVCDGADTCDTATNTCMGGELLDCDDANPCTADSCDPIEGCVNDPTPFDMDMDGHFAGCEGGDDCDDADDTVYTGAEELCDGKDNNCVMGIDEVAPVWYVDCDGDGFAADTNNAVPSCDEPAPFGGTCGWTNTRPSGPSVTDCNDDNRLVYPGQTAYQSSAITGEPDPTDFDYNCDEEETRDYRPLPSGALIISCSTAFGRCSGTAYMTTDTACGRTGTYSYCAASLRGCERVERSQQVSCR